MCFKISFMKNSNYIFCYYSYLLEIDINIPIYFIKYSNNKLNISKKMINFLEDNMSLDNKRRLLNPKH